MDSCNKVFNNFYQHSLDIVANKTYTIGVDRKEKVPEA